MGDFFEKAKKLGEKAADMTGDASEIGKYKAKIASRRSDIHDVEKKIGKYHYEHLRGNIFNEEVEAYCKEIDELKSQIAELEMKIEEAKND